MMNRIHSDHRSTILDPEILSTPYEVQTNWHVITGAPCSGKSTLIAILAKRGYRTVPESARICIIREKAKGRTNRSIRSDAAALQLRIEKMQLQVEGELPPDEVLFFDEALPGSLAWRRVDGLDPNDLLPDCFHRRYASVFVLERLPFKPDEDRVEEMELIGGFLDGWFPRDYRALGYDIVRVPMMPPEKRVDFILDQLGKQKLL